VNAQPTAAAAGTIDVGGDLTVNRLGFGAMRVTGSGIWGDPPSRERAIATVRRVVELGVNFIDTADSYGPEVSENLIADALHPYPDDLVIATKGGLIRPAPSRWEADGRPEHLREVCEGSLRRLRLEQIPLYQLHRPDPAVPLADSIGAIAELKNEGKIRHVGISNVSERQLRQAQQIVPIVSVQNRYNASDRRSESLIDLCEQEQLVFLPWAPVQEAGKNRAVAAAARRHGVTQHQVVLAWMLATSPQILPIPGTGSVAHAEENIAAAAVELSADDIDAISKGALLARSRATISGWLHRFPAGRGTRLTSTWGEQMETTESADGTVIAYDRTGDGPPLVIVLGAFCDRKTFVPPASLASRFTVCTYDRRGRGDSGDTQPYSPDLEVADLAAVIGAVSGAGSLAFVYGHSSGAALALRAAAQGVPMAALAAYEAPYTIPGTRELPEDPPGRITALVAAGRRADAVRFWMTDVVQGPAEVVLRMENSPMWPGLLALAHTLPYDFALTGDQGIPVDYLAKITAPVLVLGGANSPDWFRRTVQATTEAIPGARLVTLDGQDHGAPPEVIAPVLTDFFLGARSLGTLRGLAFRIVPGQPDIGWVRRLGCRDRAWRRRLRLPAAWSCRSKANR